MAEPATPPETETKPAEAVKPESGSGDDGEPSPAQPSAAAATSTTITTTTEKAAEEAAPSLLQRLWKAAQKHGHPEIWGVTLADPDTHVPTQIVLQKYLNANDGDADKAEDQLLKTLEWRAQMKPLELIKTAFSRAKFGGLGYVTTYESASAEAAAGPEGREVFTWNIYGGVKDMAATFGDLDEFIRWRVALMEMAVQELRLPSATRPVTPSDDPYKIYQVHDYRSISFLRQSPQVRAASTETIRVFAQSYPELLKEKFFVNVPAIMGFIYAFMKMFVAPKTVKKFHPMADGANLAREFAPSGSDKSRVEGLAEKLPAEYGGKAGELKAEGREPLLE